MEQITGATVVYIFSAWRGKREDEQFKRHPLVPPEEFEKVTLCTKAEEGTQLHTVFVVVLSRKS